MKGQRGRRSAASLTVVPLGEVPRQRAPSDLTRDEAAIWNGIVNAEPADWFSGSTRPILAQYCRHVIAARRVAGMIETLHAGVAAWAAAEQCRPHGRDARRRESTGSIAEDAGTRNTRHNQPGY